MLPHSLFHTLPQASRLGRRIQFRRSPCGVVFDLDDDRGVSGSLGCLVESATCNAVRSRGEERHRVDQYFALRFNIYRREHPATVMVPLVLLLLTLESPADLQGTLLSLGHLDPLADLPCIFDALPTKHIRTSPLTFIPTAY